MLQVTRELGTEEDAAVAKASVVEIECACSSLVGVSSSILVGVLVERLEVAPALWEDLLGIHLRGVLVERPKVAHLVVELNSFATYVVERRLVEQRG